MLPTPHRIVFALPPFSFLPERLKDWLGQQGILKIHFILLVILYLAVFGAGFAEQTLVIPQGIGILENPPFLAHLISGALSVCLPFAIATRVAALSDTPEDKNVIETFISMVQESRIKLALFNVGILIGLFSLAYTVAMSAAPRIDIYDAVTHPFTFSLYLVLRCYLYLFCYPLLFGGSIVLVYYLFRALRSDTTPYLPFHHDETGGLRKYFLAVDRPVYVIQSLTVLIALMNYIGWGGMFRVPLILTVTAPLLVTAFALLLLWDFNRLLSYKKKQEIRAIRLQEMELYPAAKQLASLDPREALDILERIEAMERLIETIKKGRQGGWQKYVINIGVVAVTQLSKPVGTILASRLLGSST